MVLFRAVLRCIGSHAIIAIPSRAYNSHKPMTASLQSAELPPAANPESGIGDDVQIQVASQWQLMWWRFRKHKVAMGATLITLLIYLVAVFAEFLAPVHRDYYAADYTYAPPQRIHWFWTDASGRRQFRPHVLGYTVEIDPVALKRNFQADPEQVIDIGFFVQGLESYKSLGLFEANVRLVGPKDPTQPFYLIGADRLGQDLFSRLIFGTRISMTIGLVGVTLSLVLGILLGGISRHGKDKSG